MFGLVQKYGSNLGNNIKITFLDTYDNEFNSPKSPLPLPIAGVLPALPLREDLAGEESPFDSSTCSFGT
jgi:hypothetical protein